MMVDFLTDVRPYLEALYFLGTLVIAVVAIYGIKQIRLMQTDMKMRADRAAKERAIGLCSDYLLEYVQLANDSDKEFEKKNLKRYTGPVGDFTPQSIPAEWVDKGDFLKRLKDRSWLSSMNRLESIAAGFTTGVADEETGFGIIGRTFCHTVKHRYDLIAGCRFESADPYWNNIVQLYLTWSPRLNKAELESFRDQIDSAIATIPDKRIPPIGPD
jgi:hypothetical protein